MRRHRRAPSAWRAAARAGFAALALAATQARADTLDTTPGARLQLAQRLSQEDASSEAAVDILVRLLGERATRGEAAESLAAILKAQPPRPGWFAIYETLRKEPSLKQADRDALALRQVLASPDDAASLRRAQAALDAVSGHARGAAAAQAAAAHLDLLRGDARSALARALKAGEGGAEAKIYARIALDQESALGPPDAALPQAVQDTLTTPTIGNRANALAKAGYLLLAERLVGAPNTCVLSACRSLAELEAARGEHWRAAVAYGAWLKVAPDDLNAQQARVQEFLDAGHDADARGACGTRDALVARVDAVRLLADIPAAATPEQVEQATAAAMERSGEPWQVRLARGRALVALNRWEEAWPLLRSVVAERPRDPDALWPAAVSGAHTGRGAEVLALWQEAVGTAPSPGQRAPLDRDLAVVYALVGEQRKRAGDLPSAKRAYVTAIAMQPGMSSLWEGLGGVLWGENPDDARQAYLAAVQIDRRDARAIASAATLSIQLGDTASAAVLLAHASGDSEELRRARELLAVAPALGAARAAGSQDRVTGAQTLARLSREHASDLDVLLAVADAYLALALPEDALSTVHLAAALAPANSRVRAGEVRALLALGRLDEADQAAQALAQAADPSGDQALVHEVRLSVLRARGTDALTRNDLGRAWQRFTEALALSPEDEWAWYGLGTVYAADGQPDLAWAYFAQALAPGAGEDPLRARMARLGQLRALITAERWDQAESAIQTEWSTSADPASADALVFELRSAQVQARLDHGDVAGARWAWSRLATRFPDTDGVAELGGTISLAEGDGAAAWAAAQGALQAHPDSVSAATLLRKLGTALGREPEAANTLDAAANRSGSSELRQIADGAALDALFARIASLNHKGDIGPARALADEILRLSPSNADALARLGGVYLDLGQGQQAGTVYESAIALVPTHIPAILGRADAYLWEGRSLKAERWLTDAYARTKSREVALKLAQVQLQRNRRHAARDTLAQTAAPEQAGAAHVVTLAPVALPDGSLPERWTTAAQPSPASSSSYLDALRRVESGDLHPEAVGSTVPLSYDARLAQTRADAARAVEINAAVGAGGFHQAGTTGGSLIAGGYGVAAITGLRLGPVTLVGDAVPLTISDASSAQQGTGVDYGMRMDLGHAHVEGRLGSSPVGFDAGGYVTWIGRLDFSARNLDFGVDTGRSPITDTLTSWAGAWDDSTGSFIGRASNTWFGGFARIRPPGGFDAGFRYRGGWVDALEMDAVGRRELTLWGRRTLQRSAAMFRIGGLGTWMAHERQIDAFTAGNAGVFSPRNYIGSFLTLDATWEESASVDVCLSARLGAETLFGDESAQISLGLHPATDLHGALAYRVAGPLTLSANAYWQTAALSWSSLGGVVLLTYRSAGDSEPVAVLPDLYGERPVKISSCAR